MIFIYDIILNWFKDTVYDFFEWESKDKIEHIKRIPLFKVKKNIINDIIYNDIKIDCEFNNKIFNMTEMYLSNRVTKVPYAFLITDGITILALKTDKFGNVKYKSKLLIDEEEEILCISSKLNIVDFNFTSKGKKSNNQFLTRNEINIRNYLLNELQRIYQTNDYNKLKYIYTEYTDNEESSDITYMYNLLVNSLKNEVNEKHYCIYNLLELIASNN